ncbi:hypothetical protein BC6307_07385 [Sutcliffiella cohnii]|uniref:Uncharacterized protein n=1 Tax=Sutcliffiella cohnii TaxID=33932 RepID=A0A223KNQ8_9BACI|nr:hypothetical protein [Sutcliffiella cohnii]AST91112.1 hypothetical protein BC6307_07385 [Sutcliffiella cohnii]
MKSISRWVIVAILILLAIALLIKGFNLLSVGKNVDGDGIGVYFLFMEINDRVPVESIPVYAIGFFISSIVAFLLSAVLVGLDLKSKEKDVSR